MKSACTAAPAGRGGGRAATACARVERGRPPLSLWWLSSPGLVFREGERQRHFSSVGRSLHRLCVRNVVLLDEHTDMVVTTTYYVIAPGSAALPGPGGGHSSPLRGVSVKAALSVVFQGSSTVPRSARALPWPVPWYHWIGGREFEVCISSGLWHRKWPPEIRSRSGRSERSPSKLCYHVGACRPASPATETKQPWRHWVQLA